MKEFLQNNVVEVLVLLSVLMIGLVLLAVSFQPTMARVEWQEKVHIVRSGESLWEISGRYCPDEVDRREWIDYVEDLNRLTSSTIHPGQRLIVLVPEEGGNK